MTESGYYPPGLEFRKDAPWNARGEAQPRYEVQEFYEGSWTVTDCQTYDTEEGAEEALTAYGDGHDVGPLRVREVWP